MGFSKFDGLPPVWAYDNNAFSKPSFAPLAPATPVSVAYGQREPGAPGGLSEGQMAAMNTLLRHQERLKGPLTLESLQKLAVAEDTPPDLKVALRELLSAEGGALFERLDKSKRSFKPGAPGGLSEGQMDVMNTMLRHQERLKGPLTRESLQKLVDAEDTPPDLKVALQKLLSEEGAELFERLDVQLKSKRGFRPDGKLSIDCVLDLAKKDDHFKAFNERKAKEFTQAYTPSDAQAKGPDGKPPVPRQMTGNDAMRELYLYSDSLPKKITAETLKSIADGTYKGAKLPPQVIAAAQYFADREGEWNNLMGKTVSRGEMCNRIARNVKLGGEKTDLIESIKKDADFFFTKGTFNRDQLQKWIDDPSVSAERKKICQTLLDDSVLFGMLDNARGGHSGGGFASRYKADDGKISLREVEALSKRVVGGADRKKSDLPINQRDEPELGQVRDDLANTKAAAEMRAGQLDDPNTKGPKGNGALFKIADTVLKIGSHIADGMSAVCSALSKIPVVGLAFVPVSVGLGTAAAGMRVGRTALNGGDMDAAWRNFGIDVGGAALSAVTVPGAGKAMTAAVKEGVRETFKHAARETGEAATRNLIKEEGSKAAGKAAGKEIGKAATQEIENRLSQPTAAASKDIARDLRLQGASDVEADLWMAGWTDHQSPARRIG